MTFFGRLFGNKEWGQLPDELAGLIRSKLGPSDFEELTRIGRAYDMFDQQAFKNDYPGFEDDEDLDHHLYLIRGFLTSMGNQLAQHQHLTDAERVLRAAIKLYPSASSAHALLSFVLDLQGKYDEAKLRAKEALIAMDEEEQTFPDRVRELFGNDQEIGELRASLLEIINR